jgi:hypothetical protein
MRWKRSAKQLTVVSLLVETRQHGQVSLLVEPEGMAYELPPAEQVLLTFRGPSSMKFEVSHAPDCLTIWRPADTEVWAATQPGASVEQIAWSANPFPGLDKGAPSLPSKPWLEWDHLPREGTLSGVRCVRSSPARLPCRLTVRAVVPRPAQRLPACRGPADR